MLLTVFTLPLVTYSEVPKLINAEPKSGSSLTGLDVNLKVLVPVLNLNVGGGSDKGSLKKKEPKTSPKVSATSLTDVTVACALLVWPNKVTFPVVGI